MLGYRDCLLADKGAIAAGRWPKVAAVLATLSTGSANYPEVGKSCWGVLDVVKGPKAEPYAFQAVVEASKNWLGPLTWRGLRCNWAN